MAFSISQSAGKDALVITLSGVIDEQSEAPLEALQKQLRGQTGAAKVVFDWNGVPSVNSFGAMCWARLIESVPANVTYEFANCGAIIVNYCSLLLAFKGRAAIASVAVAFECNHCDRRESKTYSAAQLRTMDGIETSTCPDCKSGQIGSELELEDYLAIID